MFIFSPFSGHQDYFVFDDDVIWDGDFQDFILLNEKGFRVLDHSKLDNLKHFKVKLLTRETKNG